MPQTEPPYWPLSPNRQNPCMNLSVPRQRSGTCRSRLLLVPGGCHPAGLWFCSDEFCGGKPRNPHGIPESAQNDGFPLVRTSGERGGPGSGTRTKDCSAGAAPNCSGHFRQRETVPDLPQVPAAGNGSTCLSCTASRRIFSFPDDPPRISETGSRRRYRMGLTDLSTGCIPAADACQRTH